MLGLNSDELGVDLAVVYICSKVLRNLSRRSDRECTHNIWVDLLHCESNCFVTGKSFSDCHISFPPYFTMVMAPNGHVFAQMPQPLQKK